MEKKYTTYVSPSGNTFVLRENENGTQTHIPIAEGNSDYAQYLRWLENPEMEYLTPIVTNEPPTKSK